MRTIITSGFFNKWKKLKTVFLILLLSSIGNSLFAVTYYSWPATGDDPTNLNNWWTVNNGTGAHPANFSTNSDVFTIQNGHTMVATAAWTVSGTFSSVTLAGATSVLDMSTFALSIYGITMSNAAAIVRTYCTTATPITTGKTWAGIVEFAALTGGQTIPAGTYTNLKLLNTSGTNTAAATFSAASFTTTAGGTINMVTYALTGLGTALTHAGTLNTQCLATPIVTGKTWGGTVNYNATTGGQAIMAGTYNNLTLSNTSGTGTASGSLVVNGTLTTTAGGELLLNNTAYTLTGTLATITNGGTIRTICTTNPAIAAGKTWTGTVDFDRGTGGQFIPAGTYATLLLSNTSGTNTAAGAVVVNTALTTTAGGTFDMSTFALSGTITTITNNGILKTSCTTNPPIPTGRTWGGTVQYGALAGAQTVADGTYATLTLLNTSGTNTASGAISVSTALTTTAGGTFNMSTFALSGTITTLTNNGTITTQNTSATPLPTGRTWAGTVNYNAATGGQTVMAATSYVNLTLGNTSGTSTASGAIVVNTLLTTTAGGTFNMSTFTLTGTLNTITNNGTIKTSCTTNPPVAAGNTWGGTGILEYVPLTGGQYIPAGTYASLQLDNTSGTNTAVAAFSAGTFTTTVGGTIDMVTYALTVTTAANHAGYLKTQSSSSPPISVGLTWGGTVEYNRAGNQEIAYGTYGHLIVSGGSGTKTLVDGNATVTGNFTVAASTEFADGSTTGGDNTVTVNGNIIMNGTHTTTSTSNTGGNITISGGSATHDISGTGTFWNVIMDDATYGATLSNNMTVNGKLTLTSKNITLGAYNLTLTSASGLSGGSSSSYLITNGAGMLKREIDLGKGTYDFPMGSATAYNPASIVWYATPGVTRLDGKYTATTVSAGSGLPLASSSCLTVSTLLDNGYWTFTEGVGTISGNFDLTLTRNGETNASTELQDHAIVRRNSSATAWTDPGTWAVTTDATTTASGQISPIIHTGLSSVGEFAIAKGTHSAPVVAAIGGGVTVACLNSASGTAFTDATGGGVWSITSGTGSATIGSATGIITGTAQGTVIVNYTVTTGGDCATTVTKTGTTVYDGGTITPTTTAKCSGTTTTISVSGYTGTRQWQDNTNGAGWVNGAGGSPTGTTYTTPTLTFPNSYQFRMLTQGACPSLNTVSITPLEATTADPGTATNYTFNSPSLSLAKYMALCADDYTFTQALPNSRSTIAIGQTVTITNFIAGTDASTMTGGTFNGTAIAAGFTATATTVTFPAPVAVTWSCGSTFTIVLNDITNPGFTTSGNATVSVANNSTGGLDNGTYPYSMATLQGGYSDMNANTTWNYATQNGLGHCYNNLSAGVHCFTYTNPTSGGVKLGGILNGGTSGCSPGSGGWASVSDISSGCATAGSSGTEYLYLTDCTQLAVGAKVGNCVTAGATYTTCITIPVGCDGENYCPLIDCAGTCGSGPLPIELLYFDATLKGGIVELSWATATETNNDFFIVEKTIDGGVYFDFVKVNGAGNSTSVQHYNSVDEHPFPGLSYYRLEQTDYDGKRSYSQLVPINTDPLAKLAVKYVFGNKDNNNLQYQLSSANNNPISVTVFDVMGKTVLTERIASSPDGQTLYMNASSLSKGVYILRVFDGENVAVKKFIY